MSNSSPKILIKRRSSSAAQKLEELGKEIANLVQASEKVADELIEAKEKISLSHYPGLNFISIRNVLCDLNDHDNQEWIPTTLATSGSGPWQEQEFDEFLQSKEIEIFHMPNEGINGLIVGTSGWSENDISDQIYNRTPNSLRIYTQELFVLGLIAGQDPYDFLDQKTIEEVGFDHPAIQFILNQSFAWPWPTTDSMDDDDDWEDEPPDWDSDDWRKESVLMQLGYTARANGLDESERRRILRQAFESEHLPGITTQEQRQRWGAKKSSRRLHAISNFLSWLINLQGSDKPAAKIKWVSDLMWMKRMFYAKTMRFTWPDVKSTQGSTSLNPATAWPFAIDKNRNQQPSKINSTKDSPSSRGGFLPRHALAVMIGVEARDSVESAVQDLREYIRNNNLVKPGSTEIQADDRLFSLAGRMYIEDRDLHEIVARQLIS